MLRPSLSRIISSLYSSSPKIHLRLAPPFSHSRVQPSTSLPSLPLRRNMNFQSRSYPYPVSPFTRTVISCMRQLYPDCLADKSFDNTGLLVEAPLLPTHNSRPRNTNKVLLTIDLTRAVATEAIDHNVSLVVSYHPIIFRGLKSITTNDTQQLTISLLLAHGISVYCPHTAVDTVPGGMADWLCDVVTGRVDDPESEAFTAQPPSDTEISSDTEVTTSDSDHGYDLGDTLSDASTKPTSHSDAVSDPYVSSPGPQSPNTPKARSMRPQTTRRTYSKPTYPRPTSHFHPAVISHTRSVVNPSPRDAIEAANELTRSTKYDSSNTGAGRLISFDSAQSLTLLITRIAHAIGLPKGFSMAIPQGVRIEDIQIKTVATCPGSGGSVLSKCRADLILTGELSHHETLAVTERGGCVISLFHSNSERGYLWSVMRDQLERRARIEWTKLQGENLSNQNLSEPERAILCNHQLVEVLVSEWDRDPYGIVVLDDTPVPGVKLESA